MIINDINSYLVKNKKEITTTGVGVIHTLATNGRYNKTMID